MAGSGTSALSASSTASPLRKISWAQLDPNSSAVRDIIDTIIQKSAHNESVLGKLVTQLEQGYATEQSTQQAISPTQPLPKTVQNLLGATVKGGQPHTVADTLLTHILLVTQTNDNTAANGEAGAFYKEMGEKGRALSTLTNDDITAVVEFIQKHGLSTKELRKVRYALETDVIARAQTPPERRMVGTAQKLTQMILSQMVELEGFVADNWECRLMPSDARAFALDSVVRDPTSYGISKAVSQQMRVDLDQVFTSSKCVKPGYAKPNPPGYNDNSLQGNDLAGEDPKVGAGVATRSSLLFAKSDARAVYQSFNAAMERAHLPAKERQQAWQVLRRVVVSDRSVEYTGFTANGQPPTFENPGKMELRAFLSVVKAMYDTHTGEIQLGHPRDGTYFGNWNSTARSVLGDVINRNGLLALSRQAEPHPQTVRRASEIWPNATVVNGQLHHTVELGDTSANTWQSIAAQYKNLGVTERALQSANVALAKKYATIPTGTALIIPVKLQGPEHFPVITLERQEAFNSISRRLQETLPIDPKELARMNQVNPNARLVRGRELTLPIALH